jgi:mono/diheme cytochrome c family protein
MRKQLALGAAILALAACGKVQEKNERGLRYMPDMYQSPALKSQEARVITTKDDFGNITGRREVPGGQSPIAGTVPRNFVPYHLDAAEIAKAEALVNPVPVSVEVLKKGRARFESFCAPCHGLEGDASKGYVASKFAGIASLNNEAVGAMTDGHIFHVITHGIRRMPSYGMQIQPDERWAVVHYVRILQQAAKLPAEERARMLANEQQGQHDSFNRARPVLRDASRPTAAPAKEAAK